MGDTTARLQVANQVLASFSASWIERRSGGWYVAWRDSIGRLRSKRWQTSGQDFYPTWHRLWPGGGTACTAMSQLIRWLRDQPVLPLASWKGWSNPRIGLLPGNVVETLRRNGYPESVPCVLCGEPMTRGIDWWHSGGISGPCCSWLSGCRQRKAANAAGGTP